MTKIMYVNVFWQARFGQCSRPWPREVAAPELAALDAYEDKGIRLATRVQLQMLPQFPSVHTRRERVADIVARAKREHPYEIPGVSAQPIIDGNPDYLAWIAVQTDAAISG
jgi:hypothetical protein